MPWVVKKQGKTWVVVKKNSGKVVSRHATEAKAKASIRARHANERK